MLASPASAWCVGSKPGIRASRGKDDEIRPCLHVCFIYRNTSGISYLYHCPVGQPFVCRRLNTDSQAQARLFNSACDELLWVRMLRARQGPSYLRAAQLRFIGYWRSTPYFIRGSVWGDQKAMRTKARENDLTHASASAQIMKLPTKGRLIP